MPSPLSLCDISPHCGESPPPYGLTSDWHSVGAIHESPVKVCCYSCGRPQRGVPTRRDGSPCPSVLQHTAKSEFVGVFDFTYFRRISTAPSPRELPNVSEAEGVIGLLYYSPSHFASQNASPLKDGAVVVLSNFLLNKLRFYDIFRCINVAQILNYYSFYCIMYMY